MDRNYDLEYELKARTYNATNFCNDPNHKRNLRSKLVFGCGPNGLRHVISWIVFWFWFWLRHLAALRNLWIRRKEGAATECRPYGCLRRHLGSLRSLYRLSFLEDGQNIARGVF